MLHRQVRIYRPTKTTTQSGKGKLKRWLLDWDPLQGAGRWENDLMGWASSADFMQGTVLAFRTREDAVAFVSLSRRKARMSSSGERRWIVRETGGRETAQCTLADRTLQAEKQGWDYQVQEPKEPKIPPKSYCQSSRVHSIEVRRADGSPSEQFRSCARQTAHPSYQVDDSLNRCKL